MGWQYFRYVKPQPIFATNIFPQVIEHVNKMFRFPDQQRIHEEEQNWREEKRTTVDQNET